MSIRTKVLGMVDVMMRVPPILVIDEILKIGMGIPSRTYQTANSVDTGGGGGGVMPDPADTSLQDILLNNSSDSSLSASSSSVAYNVLNNVTTNITNATLEQTIDNATTAAVTAGGVLSSSFGAILEDLAKDIYLSDLLSLTSVKILICVLGK